MKQKHLSLEERETIEDMLKESINFTEIGKAIGKHRKSQRTTYVSLIKNTIIF